MGVEYAFYPCKFQDGMYTILGNFIRSDNSEKYELNSVIYRCSLPQGFPKKMISSEFINPLDKYIFSNFDGCDSPTVPFVSRETIAEYSEFPLKRGFMSKEDAEIFIDGDYDGDMIDCGKVKFIPNERYGAMASVYHYNDYVPVSYIDYNCKEYLCNILNDILYDSYIEADGFLIAIYV